MFRHVPDKITLGHHIGASPGGLRHRAHHRHLVHLVILRISDRTPKILFLTVPFHIDGIVLCRIDRREHICISTPIRHGYRTLIGDPGITVTRIGAIQRIIDVPFLRRKFQLKRILIASALL